MKPEDLMIGDWFRFRYTIDGKEIVKTFRISRIMDDIGYVWGDGFGCMCKPERLEPIPITPEILEKNGWKHDPSLNRCITSCRLQVFSTQLMSWDSKYHCLDIKIRNRERLYPYNIPELRLIIPCDYVHELQHALKLCGIDKTIVINSQNYNLN